MFRYLRLFKNILEILLRVSAYLWGTIISIAIVRAMKLMIFDISSFKMIVSEDLSKYTSEELNYSSCIITCSFLVSIFILIGTRKFSDLFNEWEF